MALKITWLGSASFMLEDSAGRVVFIDPWLDADSGNPGCPIKVEDVARADLVLVTHGDPSHYGRGDSVRVAVKTGCRYASNAPLCKYIVDNGLLPSSQVLPLAIDQLHRLKFIDVTVFSVIHPPYLVPLNSDVPGEPNTGFCITMGGVSVLYTGDTVSGDAVYRRVAAECNPLVGCFPISGASGEGHGTIEESVELAASITGMASVKYVFPHYRYSPKNPAVGMLSDAVQPLGVKVVMLEPGQVFLAKNGVSGKS